MISIIIADEREQNREGIESALSNEPSVSIAGYAATGKEVLELLKTIKAEIVIIHFNIPVLNGIETAKTIKAKHPETKVLLTLDEPTQENVNSINFSAALGCVLTTVKKEELLRAINTVADGKPYYCQQIVDVLRKMSKSDTLKETEEITDLDKKILQCISESLSSKEIAPIFGMTEDAVKAHRKLICRKLNVKTSAEAVKIGVQRGWIS